MGTGSLPVWEREQPTHCGCAMKLAKELIKSGPDHMRIHLHIRLSVQHQPSFSTFKPGGQRSRLTMWLLLCLLTFLFSAGDSAKSPGQPCDTPAFNDKVQLCLSAFNESMKTSGYDQECPWPTTKRIYNELKKCVDHIVHLTRCRGLPADRVYLDVQRNYYSLCGVLSDPPLTTLIALIAPAIVVTLLLPCVCVKLTTKGAELDSSIVF